MIKYTVLPILLTRSRSTMDSSDSDRDEDTVNAMNAADEDFIDDSSVVSDDRDDPVPVIPYKKQFKVIDDDITVMIEGDTGPYDDPFKVAITITPMSDAFQPNVEVDWVVTFVGWSYPFKTCREGKAYTEQMNSLTVKGYKNKVPAMVNITLNPPKFDDIPDIARLNVKDGQIEWGYRIDCMLKSTCVATVGVPVVYKNFNRELLRVTDNQYITKHAKPV